MWSQPGQEMSQEMEEAEEGWAWAWVEALCLLLAELAGVSACGI